MRRYRVLLVDDYQDALDLYSEYLDLVGYETHTATNGIAALQMARAIHPEVIVLDLGLPGLDGIAVLRTLHADPDLRGAPVIVMTAYPGDDYADVALASGAVAVLKKPCLPDELVRAMTSACSMNASWSPPPAA